MKNFQIRLSDEVHEAIKSIAKERDRSIADVVRDSLEAYVIGCLYAREGRRLTWEDPTTKERAEVFIPSLTMRTLLSRTESERKEREASKTELAAK